MEQTLEIHKKKKKYSLMPLKINQNILLEYNFIQAYYIVGRNIKKKESRALKKNKIMLAAEC